jgi:ketosteroid isomerase-like protein
MSHENVARLRGRLEEWDPTAEVEAWKRGQLTVDVSLLDPNVVYEDGILPDQVRETGLQGVARAVERWLEPFEEVRIELERIVGSGDRLVSIHRFQALARYTGIEAELRYAYLWEFRDGKVIHFRSLREPEQALDAAGLSEQAGALSNPGRNPMEVGPTGKTYSGEDSNDEPRSQGA